MKKYIEVLLITGPAGSGKTTLARYAANQSVWVMVSEDDYWVKHDWGSRPRTPEQEKVIQHEVLEDVVSQTESGNKVALEFILYYPNKPNPLTNYQESLMKRHIQVKTIVLKPDVEEILRRLKVRGRPHDINNLEVKLKDAKYQINCLDANYIEKNWVIDPTNLSVENLFAIISK